MLTKMGRGVIGCMVCVAVAVCLALPSGASGAEMVANGDFETDADLFVTWPGYVGDGSNPAQITGWTGTGGHGINPVVPGAPSDAPFRDNGDNTTSVAFLQGISSLEQVITGFTVGQDYTLSLDFNSRNCCGDFPIVQVLANGEVVAASSELFPDPGAVPPVGDTNPWYHADIDFAAPATEITLAFNSAPAAGGDASLVLDNISIVAVPEPSTALLALLGALLWGLGWRRR